MSVFEGFRRELKIKALAHAIRLYQSAVFTKAQIRYRFWKIQNGVDSVIYEEDGYYISYKDGSSEVYYDICDFEGHPLHTIEVSDPYDALESFAWRVGLSFDWDDVSITYADWDLGVSFNSYAGSRELPEVLP